MRKLLIAAAAVALAGPAHAQQVFTPELDEDIERAIPPAEEVEAAGAAVDAVVGAVLDVPVGPIVDAVEAADPDRRGRRSGPRDRTLRDVAGRDDPYFEERLRDSIRRVTAGMADTMDQVAILAPVLRRSLADMERDIAIAIAESRARRGRYERR
jgi:hypothetical protein